jgi:hypothetical protein
MAGFTHRGRGLAKPGQVAQTSEDPDMDLPQAYGENQFYPGYIPQRYIPPVAPVEIDNAGEVGDGTVPNNTDRGNYGHGVLVDSHVTAKDHSQKDKSDFVPQVMPEKADQFEYEPIKVTVVGEDPDEIIRMNIATYIVNTPASTAGGGQPTVTGLTPQRVLGHDPRRRRAVIAISNMQGGSVPVMLTQEQSSPAYGFPIASATTFPLELFTTEEVWVSGSTATDSFTVTVLAERYVNADRLYSTN